MPKYNHYIYIQSWKLKGNLILKTAKSIVICDDKAETININLKRNMSYYRTHQGKATFPGEKLKSNYNSTNHFPG